MKLGLMRRLKAGKYVYIHIVQQCPPFNVSIQYKAIINEVFSERWVAKVNLISIVCSRQVVDVLINEL